MANASDTDFKLLVVDDESEICEIVREVAEDVGFRVATCSAIQHFQKAYEDFQPDVIILDLVMPGGDGIEAIEYMARIGSRTQIILFSGMEARVLRAASQIALSHDLPLVKIMRKPVCLTQLETALKSSMELNRPVTCDRLRQAVSNHELEVFYQPKINLLSPHMNEITSFEALVRWNHPQRGLVPPHEFIALAEQSGIIHQLTHYVTRAVCEQINEWNSQGYSISVAINMSALVLSDQEQTQSVLNVIEESRVDCKRIIFETTETGVMKNIDTLAKTFTKICLKGISLSIDDFGTGYSSLIQLYRLPFTELKIDQSFVMEMGDNEEAVNIVHALVNLAHDLGISTCAEGVQTLDVAQMLSSMGCEKAQGFFYSKPVPANDATSLLRKQSERMGLIFSRQSLTSK